LSHTVFIEQVEVILKHVGQKEF